MTRRTSIAWFGLLLSLLALAACSAGRSDKLGDDDDDGSGTAGSGGGLWLDAGSGGSGNSSPGDCSEAAKLVYVVGTGNELYSFYPPELKFEQIGVISCPAGMATPFSMAVDRKGTAWVLFSDGNLFNVDITTAACTATSFTPNQLSGFDLFGMGFVSDTPSSTAESLHLASYDGIGIAKLNLQSLAVEFVGAYDALSGPAELTGTGDAQLFGFFLDTPVIVAEIDKSSGHIITQAPQPSVDIGSAWAFAFWGGDFWLFTSPNGFSSQVDQYSPASSSTQTVVTNVGFNIVGAGVSTCAPTLPPH